MNLRTASFTVPGEPVSWARSGQRKNPKTGKVIFFTAAKSGNYRAQIQKRAEDAGVPLFEAAVTVTIEAVFTRPKTSYRKSIPRGREPCTKRPDADNIGKQVLDALNGVAWLDDRQVARLAVTKLVGAQGEPAALRVRIEEMLTAVPMEQAACG